MFGFGRYVPQHYQGPQTDDTRDHTQYPPTNRSERNTWQRRYTSPYRTQTSRRGNHQGPDETRRSVADTQSRYVNLNKFDRKVGEWDNWYHQFEVLATHYNWDDRERLVRLVSCLKGPALTVHRSFSQRARNTYAHCIAALQERYGSRRPALIITRRAELSTVRQEEGESMDTFGNRVYALTNQAYPNLAPALLQSLAIPAFLKGLRDRNAAQEAMKFRDPKFIQEAVVTVTHIQGASRIFGNRGVPTARQVSFDGTPTKEAPSTDMDRLQGVVRQLQQLAVTNKVTPTSDACYTCGGCGHRSRDCANKRKLSPSPLTCFECNGKGHIASECSNRLRRRKETARTRHKHQYRGSSSSSNKSSADSDSVDSRIRRRNLRHRPRRSHHRHGNYQNSRRSPRRGDRSHGHGARQADHSRDGSDTSRGREYDRAKYQSRDGVKTSDYNSQNPRPGEISTSPLRRVDEAVKPLSN